MSPTAIAAPAFFPDHGDGAQAILSTRVFA